LILVACTNNIVQHAEGRELLQDQVQNAAWLTSVRAFCQRTFSHSTAKKVFEFWFNRQGKAQVAAHDAGSLFVRFI